jgi:hypothetical protein
MKQSVHRSCERNHPSSLHYRLGCGALIAHLVACSGVDGTVIGGDVVQGNEPATGEDEESGGAAADPLYLISTTVFGPEGTATYLLTVPSLDAGVEPDYDGAVSLDGFTSLYGRNGHRDVYVGSASTPEITRWLVGDDGRLTPGDTVSFAPLGVTMTADYPEFVAFVSETKAYFYDSAGARLVIWNPAEMTVTGELALPADTLGALQPSLGGGLVMRPDGTLLVGITWYDSKTLEAGDRVRVIAVDTALDQVSNVTDDEGCGNVFFTSRSSDGTAYFSGASWTQVIRDLIGVGYGAIPCNLRIVPPGRSFDDAYTVNMAALTGRPTGELVLAGDDVAFVRAWHDEDAPSFDGDANAHTAHAAYRWWRWKLGEPTASLVEPQIPSVGGGIRYWVDDRTYVTNPTADFASTTLAELSAERGIVPHITLRGYPYGVVRVR